MDRSIGVLEQGRFHLERGRLDVDRGIGDLRPLGDSMKLDVDVLYEELRSRTVRSGQGRAPLTLTARV